MRKQQKGTKVERDSDKKHVLETKFLIFILALKYFSTILSK